MLKIPSDCLRLETFDTVIIAKYRLHYEFIITHGQTGLRAKIFGRKEGDVDIWILHYNNALYMTG